MRSIASGLILLIGVWIAPVSAQLVRVPISLMVFRGLNTIEYTKQTRRDAIPVFLAGEDIIVEWRLSAGLPGPLELAIPSGEPAALLEVAVLEAPDGAAVPRLIGSRFTRRRGDSLPVPGPLPRKAIVLRYSEEVSLFVKVEGVTVPGQYKLRLRPAFSGPESRNETIQFALRPVSSKAERAELAFRSVVRAAEDRNCRSVRQSARGLLAIHPFAASAHKWVGDCELQKGNRRAAIAAFERAHALLDQQRDDLLIENYGEDAVRGRADDLRREIDRVRANRRPVGAVLID
jgi:hypothetical protein